MNNGFFAYSTEPNFSSQSIEGAIEEINKKKITRLKSWRSFSVSGKLIIREVLNAINEAEYFCADLTEFSDNVLFEIGYAITKKKPIWLVLDTSHIESKRKYQELGLLDTIGYSSYHNTKNIVDNFFKDKRYSDLYNPYEKIMETVSFNQSRKILLFLKGQIDTDYSQTIANSIENQKLPCVIDEPMESRVQPITWYLKQLNYVNAVLAEFSATTREGYEIQNSKCSLVSGMAIGLELDVLMLSEEPYKVPVDYREMLKKYQDKNRCRTIVLDFLKPLKENALQSLTKKTVRSSIIRRRNELQQINFGEYLAEHETEKLYEYYVETQGVKNLIRNEYNVVVGRKGAGKTATLYFLKDDLEQDIRNHVCLIKPINFELDALLYLLNDLPQEYEKSYLIESTWKLLIYTEIAKSIYEKLKIKSLFSLNDSHKEFIDFIENNSSLFLTNFSVRFEKELKSLTNLETESVADFKIKVSELLHEEILRKVRELIFKIFDKDRKIIVLIDNLDKSWRKNEKLELQSKLLLGLLGVTGRVVKDLTSLTVKGIEKRIGFHLTIFLRSDIFKYILKIAREPDKIEFTKFHWYDPEILFRIIEERFVCLSYKEVSEVELWEKYIVTEIEGQLVKDYIYNKIVPRPRDIIFFFKEAQNAAVLRGHTQISEEDIKKAYQEYSRWFFTSIVAENGITVEQMEDFLYELVGSTNIIDKNDIAKHMRSVGILANTEKDIEYFIDYLVSLSILGREVTQNEFRYEYDFQEYKKLKRLESQFGSRRYKIHNALIPYLECSVIQ